MRKFKLRCKLTALFGIVSLLPLYSYSPPVVPDTSFFPSLLDSIYHYQQNPDSLTLNNDNRILYTYDEAGHLAEQRWLSWDEEFKRFRLGQQFCWHGICTGGSWLYEYDENERLVEKLLYDSIDPSNNIIFRERHVLSYDLMGNQTGLLFYGWQNWEYDSVGMILLSKEFWDYDSLGKQIEHSNYYWDQEFNDWLGSWRENWLYDSLGNLSEKTDQYWDQEINDWIQSWRENWLYDSLGRLSEKTDHYWDQDLNQWIDGGWNKWNYDSIGNQIEFESNYWNQDLKKWIKNGRELWYYDSIGNQIEHLNYYWDQDLNQWIGGGWDKYNYDSIGNQIEFENYYWDQDLKKWIGNWREYRKYDSNGNRIEYESYSWDRYLNKWVGTWREQWNYDSIGNVTEHESIEWDSETGSWIERSRAESEYDPLGHLTNQYIFNWDYDQNKLVLSEITANYWSSFLSFPDQFFFTEENCRDSSFLGTLKIHLENPEESPIFTIISREDDGPFHLDTLSGEIWVLDCSKLDFELKTEYLFTVKVNLADSSLIGDNMAEVKIFVNNINDNAPVLSDTVFDIDENSDPGTTVGIIIASDPDGNLDPFSYSIIEGNDNSVFRIESIDGTISLNEGAYLDYETRNTYTLTVEVSDGLFTDEAAVTIMVNDIVEVFNSRYNPDHLIKLYPNPTDGHLFLEVPEKLRDGFELEMTTLTGRLILQQSGYVDRLNLSDLPAGLYILRIRTGQSIMVGRVLIY